MRFCTRNAGPACLAAVLLLPELVGQPPSAVPRPRNLLLITLDTMRADRLPAYGFPSVHTPALDRIATEGDVFDETYAAVALPSHASMFTGIYPPRLGVRDNAGAPLPTTHHACRSVARAAATDRRLCVASSVLEPGRGLQHGYDLYSAGEPLACDGAPPARRRAGEVVDEALSWALAWRPRGTVPALLNSDSCKAG